MMTIKNTKHPWVWLKKHLFDRKRVPRSRHELLSLLRDARDQDLFNFEAFAMIEGVMNVSEKQARDAMIPRTQMVILDHAATIENVLPVVISSAHSRFPVITDNRDEIGGILLAKDLLHHLMDTKINTKMIKDITRPAVFIPESLRLDVLLREFRLTHNHMAIVVDEYGAVAGLITIEDVLEEIVGEIEDETDLCADDPNIQKINFKEYIVKAQTPLDEFLQVFDLNVPVDSVETIGGLLMQQFGKIPKKGEMISIPPYTATILLSSKRHIQQIKITKTG